ncbi:MAG TPA: ATP-binding protein [Polyangiaceae bacterium]
MAEEPLAPELIGGLLGLVVHDLRNPLSALHSNASFLRSAQEKASPDAQEALEDVAASCEALGHVIDNLEILALSLRTEDRFDKNYFTLVELVTEAVNRSRSLAVSYGVRIDWEPPSDLDVKLTTSRDMLGRALGNLIKNAIQHAHEGPVRVSLRLDGESAIVRVEDQGMPISAELTEQAFTAAGQLSAKNAIGGRYSRGLGLFAARVAASSARATIRSIAVKETGNAFELLVPTSNG